MRPFWLYSVVENRTDEMLLCATSYWEGLVEKTEPDSFHGCTVRGQEATGTTRNVGNLG